MALNTALVDRARRLVDTPTPVRVEGTTQFQVLHYPWFRCRLTLLPAPEAPDAQGGESRVPRQGTLLVGRKDVDGNLTEINSDDRLEIRSKELGDYVYEVTGDGEPIRKRRRQIGWMGTVVRVEEHPFVRAEP